MEVVNLHVKNPACPCEQFNLQSGYCPLTDKTRINASFSCPFYAVDIAAMTGETLTIYRRPDPSERPMSSDAKRKRKKALVKFYSDIVVIILTRELSLFWPFISPEEVQQHGHEVMRLILQKIPVSSPTGQSWRARQYKDQVQHILDAYIENLKNSEL